MASDTKNRPKSDDVIDSDDSDDEDTVMIDNTTATTTTSRRQQGHGHAHSNGEMCSGDHDGGSGKAVAPTSSFKKIVRLLLLFSMVPVLFSMPLFLKKGGELVSNNRALLFYVWAFYAVVWAAIVYSKRHQITISSFVNHNLLWMIVALGTFIVLDIPKMIQQVELRREVLLVWCTITWIPNILIFFFDDTDHKTKEQQEEQKELRKKKKDDERKAKLEEKRKKRQKERMEKYTPTQRMMLNAGVYVGLLLLVLLLAWQTYRWYLKTQQNILERQRGSTVEEEVEPVYGEY
ncbi:hypothetical protein SAMD00019534_013650 [Acytostelium subglobosum LB1]|uniref:hypothetical protein n=1 Tax=Acytostelium subglobosum LB1 TaxID=1410327 RepID=UPI000644B52A|nr:hypothetical protein SAMD00019534_013650 [Acytostelium subglobosum LB1]GAM18190.1 hypothetical protein SAMD00019534_013650 [Acytostelium subglobosum LB1]|eukprot:XP_012758786.1 hypothetical protein SAMD00019534_013650 [Acytostelium subglobosum LB1]